MDKNFPGTFSSDAEVNDFCNDLITSVRQMKEKKVCRTTVVIPIIETRNKTGLTQEKFAKMLGVPSRPCPLGNKVLELRPVLQERF